MTRSRLLPPAMMLALAVAHSGAEAQGAPRLHVNPRWKECSFQLDPSLTQSAWRQFTDEAGLVTFFRPISDARPMGKGRFELSVLQWKTNIDDRDAAWNDTFVHPDSAHWLFEGSGLEFPGLTARVGVTDRTDLGLYFTKSPGANYGFYGAQLQRAVVGSATSAWAVSARGSYVAMYGPEDLGLRSAGAELVASRAVVLNRWVTVSPYAGVSGYLSNAHEKSAVVSLHDETVGGARGTLGAALQISKARLGAEYTVAKVSSFSMKIGVGM